MEGLQSPHTTLNTTPVAFALNGRSMPSHRSNGDTASAANGESKLTQIAALSGSNSARTLATPIVKKGAALPMERTQGVAFDKKLQQLGGISASNNANMPATPFAKNGAALSVESTQGIAFDKKLQQVRAKGGRTSSQTNPHACYFTLSHDSLKSTALFSTRIVLKCLLDLL